MSGAVDGAAVFEALVRFAGKELHENLDRLGDHVQDRLDRARRVGGEEAQGRELVALSVAFSAVCKHLQRALLSDPEERARVETCAEEIAARMAASMIRVRIDPGRK